MCTNLWTSVVFHFTNFVFFSISQLFNDATTHSIDRNDGQRLGNYTMNLEMVDESRRSNSILV